MGAGPGPGPGAGPWTDLVQLQRRGRHDALHLLLDPPGLPGPLRHPQGGLGFGLVVQQRGLVVLMEEGRLVVEVGLVVVEGPLVVEVGLVV